MPCYNPPKNWAETVVDSYNKLAETNSFWKLNLIIVNDGSNKGINTENIDKIKANIPNFNFISYESNKGKGYALRKGVENSSGEYIILTDIDFPYTHKSMFEMIKELTTNNSDVLAGERNSQYYKQTPVIRKNISKFLKYRISNVFNKLNSNFF